MKNKLVNYFQSVYIKSHTALGLQHVTSYSHWFVCSFWYYWPFYSPWRFSLIGLVLLLLLYLRLILIFSIAHSVSILQILNHLFSSFLLVFLNYLFFGILLFIVYTTPLSSIICSLGLFLLLIIILMLTTLNISFILCYWLLSQYDSPTINYF